MEKDKLSEYAAKRKFEATPEPAPAATGAGSGPLLFVVQQHSARRVHYGFLLRGEKLKGSFALVRTAQDPKSWLIIKHRDRFALQVDITARNRSVLSGLAVEDLKVVPVRRIPASQLVPSGKPVPMPDKVAPMLA